MPRTNPATIKALGRLGVSLSDAEVDEFANLLADIGGASVSPDQARESASALLLFMQALAVESADVPRQERTEVQKHV